MSPRATAPRQQRSAAGRVATNWVSAAIVVLAVGLIPCAFAADQAGVSTVAAQRFLRMDYAPEATGTGLPPKTGRVLLSFAGDVRGELRREVGIPLAYVDILGARVDVSPMVTPFESGPVRIARLSQLSTVPPVVRATFFLRELHRPRLTPTAKGLAIDFMTASRDDLAGTAQALEGRTPYAPIAPEPMRRPRSAPVNLDVKGADATTLLRELAHQTGMTAHFRDPLDAYVDVSALATDAVSAMRLVAGRLNAVLTLEDGEIWISKANNPLLAFSDQDQVRNADLRGLALADVLRALGQMGGVNVVMDRSLETIKDRPVDMLLHQMSYRRAFETVLNVHNLVVRSIDHRTLMVTTDQAARQATGHTIRVVPVHIGFARLVDPLRRSLPKDVWERVSFSEDLGNVVIVGDKEAVDHTTTVMETIETKLTQVGVTTERRMFQPVNTAADPLIKLVNETLGATATVQLVLDKRTDRIVVTGAPVSVERAMTLLRQLDQAPTRQALIHIRLVELARTDVRRLGLQVADINTGVNDLNKPPSSVVLPASLNYLETLSKVRTLANPTLRCMDRETAKIDISEQIPVMNRVVNYIQVATGTVAPTTIENWTTSDIGLKLTVTPEIHADNEVTMKVLIDQTDLVQLVDGHPWTAKRNLDTRIRVKSNETVVIGGLIRRKRTNNRRPVPLLSKIPGIKKLARWMEYRQDDVSDSELVVMITPAVVLPSSGMPEVVASPTVNIFTPRELTNTGMTMPPRIGRPTAPENRASTDANG